MRPSSRLRLPARVISSTAFPMTMRWMAWAGTAAPVLGPASSAVTSSHAVARKPAASIIARITSGARRKFVVASGAHITGKIGGCTGPAIGSWNASTPPGRSTRAKPAYRRRSEEHTSELQSRGHLVCRLLLEKKKKKIKRTIILKKKKKKKDKKKKEKKN